MESWYCKNCKKELSQEKGPSHVWDTGHDVDYSFTEGKQTYLDGYIKRK